ncbi:hypothetical protein C8R46DRAFT_1147013 [Mycena filopes]|nr:hypothetical protein C8R46DRAFT_1147013 [Mycena filopes]
MKCVATNLPVIIPLHVGRLRAAAVRAVRRRHARVPRVLVVVLIIASLLRLRGEGTVQREVEVAPAVARVVLKAAVVRIGVGVGVGVGVRIVVRAGETTTHDFKRRQVYEARGEEARARGGGGGRARGEVGAVRCGGELFVAREADHRAGIAFALGGWRAGWKEEG